MTLPAHPPFTFRLIVRLAIILALAAPFGGCALLRRRSHPTAAAGNQASVGPLPQSAAAPLGETVPEGRVGTVRMIGRGGRFVLVETLNGGILSLPDGQELHCRANAEPGALATADLRLSRERRQQFATADVVDGQPGVGDAVFVGGAGLTPSSAQPGSIVAPGLLPAGAGGLLPPPTAGGRP